MLHPLICFSVLIISVLNSSNKTKEKRLGDKLICLFPWNEFTQNLTLFFVHREIVLLYYCFFSFLVKYFTIVSLTIKLWPSEKTIKTLHIYVSCKIHTGPMDYRLQRFKRKVKKEKENKVEVEEDLNRW